jgi:hypothetical protein
MDNDHFTFGIYPGSAVGPGAMANGMPDDPQRILEALDRLQGSRNEFLVRCYFHYIGNGEQRNATPQSPEQFAVNGRKLDLVVCHQTDETPLDGWLDCIRRAIASYGDALGHLQIAEEVSVKNLPADGYFSNSLDAMVAGVVVAKEEIKKRGLQTHVGINATPSFGSDNFWVEVAAHGVPAFFDSLDYIGLDFFPDVFMPLPAEEFDAIVAAAVREFRKNATGAGLEPKTPLFITENGWPTGKDRSPEMQAQIVGKIVNIISAIKDECSIDGYEYFSLRDLASNKPDNTVMDEFGLMDDAYRPKPAFDVYQQIIASDRSFSR